MERKTQNMEHGTWNIKQGEKLKPPCSTPRPTPHAPCSRGFTLVEMLVSIALFSFVMIATTSVLLSVVDANRKAQGLRSAIDNLSLALDSMSRNLRTGSGYPPNGNSSSCSSSITFLDQKTRTVTYFLQAGSIRISRSDGLSGSLTAPEITIDRLCFYAGGTTANDNIQPRILITVGGEVSKSTVQGARVRTGSRFDIQTFVSQRLMDVPNN